MRLPEFLIERRGVASNTELTIPLPIHPAEASAVGAIFVRGDVTPVGAAPTGWQIPSSTYFAASDLTYIQFARNQPSPPTESVTFTWTGAAAAAGIVVLSPDTASIGGSDVTETNQPNASADNGAIGDGEVPVIIGASIDGDPSIFPTGATSLPGFGDVTYLDDQYSGVDVWAITGTEVLKAGSHGPVTYDLGGTSATAPNARVISHLFYFKEPVNPGPTTVVQSPNRIACVTDPVSFSGRSEGEANITSAGAALRRGIDNLYWDLVGSTWQATRLVWAGTLTNPGETSTGWSLSFPGALTEPGRYFVEPVGVDAGVVPTSGTLPAALTGGANQDVVATSAVQVPQGAFHVEFVVDLPDYSTGTAQGLGGQYITGGDMRAWSVRLGGDGKITVYMSNGALGTNGASTTPNDVYFAGAADGAPIAVRVDFFDLGASYEAEVSVVPVADPFALPPAKASYTQIGLLNVTVPTIHPGSVNIHLGSRYRSGTDVNGGGEGLVGSVYQMRLYDEGAQVASFPDDPFQTNGALTPGTRTIDPGLYTGPEIEYCVAGTVATPRVRAPKLGYGHDIVVEVVGRPNGISPGVVLARLPVQTSRGLVDSTRSARSTRGYFERRLDGTSDAEVTATFSPLDLRRCCDDLAVIDDYAHELRVWWDGLIAWVGPITYLEHLTDGIYIQAKDRSTHLDTRTLGGHEHTGAALSRVFRDYFLDAYYQDPWGASLIVQDVGVTGDREVSDTEAMIAARAIDELARTGIDWTMVGTKMIVGGQEVPVRTLPTLTDHHFTTPLRPVSDGSRRATDFVMSGDQVAGRATLPESDPRRARYGLITGRAQDSKILDTESVAAAAQTRLDFGADPVYLELGDAVLSPKAPVALVDLIPGARVPILAAATCRTVAASFRLSRVRVELSGEVSIQVQPLGTTIPGA